MTKPAMTMEQVRDRLIEMGAVEPSESLVVGWYRIVNGIDLPAISKGRAQYAERQLNRKSA